MSKIRYVSNKYIDRSKWDKCILNSVNSRVYAMSWYLDIVSVYWDAIIYEDYKLVMPVIFKKYLFIYKVYHPSFCQQLGFFSPEISLIEDENIIHQMCCLVINKFKLGVEFAVTSEFYKMNTSYLKDLFLIKKRINIELNLNCKYSTLNSSYHLNTKRNLKQNLRNKLYIDYTTDCSNFINHFKLYVGMKASLKNSDYSIIYNIVSESINRKHGSLVSVTDEHQNILASAFILSFKKRDILLFHFTNPEYKKRHAMTFLIDWYIKKNSHSDRTLDFEGSNILGVRRFYMGFGAKEHPYYLLKKSFKIK